MGAKILWAVVVGFALGVFVRSLFPLGLAFAGFAVLIAVAILFLSLIDRSKVWPAIIVATALLAFAGGITRMHVAVEIGDPALTSQLGTKVVIEGIVFAEPDVRESSVRLSVRADTIFAKGATTTVDAGVLVVAPAHMDILYGDRIRAEGTLELPEAFAVGTTVPNDSSRVESREVEGRVFDYPLFLAKDGIIYELPFATVARIGENEGNPIKAVAIWLKQMYLEGLQRALSEPQAGLAGGITVGDKRGLGAELSETFRAVGLTHIIVLSGYNIMIVIYGISQVLTRFSVRRSIQFGASIFVAALFAVMTGFASASVRAAAMATIAVAGSATGRMYLAGRALLVVAAAMIMWNPLVLVYDPGFQLSVLATAGLIVFTPLIAPRLTFITAKFALREIAATTISTQLVVLPLILYQNGQLPIYSLFANLLVLVAVPWAMLFSLVAALAGIVLGPLAVILAFPAYALLAYVIGVAKLFAALPFAALSIPAFSAWWLVPMYALLFAVAAFLPRREVSTGRTH